MKKYILLLTSFALSIYFYSNKKTDFLLIMCLFVMFISMINFDNLLEHAGNIPSTTGTVPPNEAIQILSSMYNQQKLKVTELEADKITVKGKYKDFVVADGWISSSDGINCNGLNSAGYVNANDIKANNIVKIGKDDNLQMLLDGTANGIIKAKGRLHIATDNDHIYLLPKGETIVGNEWGGSGNLRVRGNGGDPVLKNQSYRIAGRRGRLDNWANRCADGDKDRDIGMICEGGHGQADNGLWQIVNA